MSDNNSNKLNDKSYADIVRYKGSVEVGELMDICAYTVCVLVCACMHIHPVYVDGRALSLGGFLEREVCVLSVVQSGPCSCCVRRREETDNNPVKTTQTSHGKQCYTVCSANSYM